MPRNPEARERQRQQIAAASRARQRALMRLRRAHPEEYREYHAEEAAKEGVTPHPRDCPKTKFPDGTRCGEYNWHAPDCPERKS